MSSSEITVVRCLISNGGHGGNSWLSLAPPIRLFLFSEEEHYAHVWEGDVISGTYWSVAEGT